MIHPLLLVRVRKEIHRTDLAVELGCTVDDLVCWEKGLALPTMRQLRRWKNVLRSWTANTWHRKVGHTTKERAVC